jgi:predicted DNA-binding transcriptional regulator AlpA
MPRRQNPSPIQSRRAINVTDFTETYAVSRSTTYSLIRSGQLSDVKIGSRRVILIDDAERLLKKESA